MHVDLVPVALRGKISNLLPEVLWVRVSDPRLPPVLMAVSAGHPVRLSSPRERDALVGETTFHGSLGAARRLIALVHPAEMRLVDRRAQLRVKLRKSIGVRVSRESNAGHGGNFATGTSVDIGLSGMSFETSLHLAVGDHVFITLVLEHNRAMHAMAQVVRLDDTPQTAHDGSDIQRPALFHMNRHVTAAVRWDAMAPSDRQNLEDLLLRFDRAVNS